MLITMLLLVNTENWLFWWPTLISLLAILWASFHAPWKLLLKKSIRQHLFIGTTIALGLFWAGVKINVHDLYQLHPSLITTVVFIFGFEFGLIVGALALLITQGLLGLPLENISFHYLTGVLTPALVTHTILLVITKVRIQNVFIYTLGGSFLGGMVAALSIGAISILCLWLADSTLLWPVWDNRYLFLLLTFPEGFCNGAIVSTITLLRPDLMKTYNDDFYLDGK